MTHAAVAREARRALPDDQAVRSVADLFALLANPTRLKLLLTLAATVRGARPELCVSDLADTVDASESMTSHQLRLLRNASLVDVRREGKFALYALREGPQAHLLADALEFVSATR